ncbi:MAG: type III secretion system export apparatus subunit SctS [Thiotrichaceae bacterium]
MGHEFITHQATLALQLVLYLSLPILIVATVVGLIVSLLQALTSIQEQTLPHAFKLVAIIFAISITVRWLGPELYEFAVNNFTQFPQLDRK